MIVVSFYRLATLATVLTFAVTEPAIAQKTGRDWAVRSQKVSFAFETLTANAKMTLYRGSSIIGTRTLDVALLEQGRGAYDMGTIKIKTPASLAGTKLLSWSNDKSSEQQWLTTSRSKRPRRIGGRGRRATFVNSDYTFEDLLKWQVDNYRYNLIGSSSCPAKKCTKVRATPTTGRSAYGALLIDYDDKARIIRIKYFRPGSKKVWKEQIFKNYRLVGKSWQPGQTTMTNSETGTRTHVRWSNYRANVAIKNSQFQPR